MRPLILAVAIVSILGGAERVQRSLPAESQGHLSSLRAKIVLQDGTSRTVTLQGVGCSASMCSRVEIHSKAESGSVEKTWLDDIAAIRSTTETGAVFTLKDGTERRLSVVPDNRFLYFANGKMALANVKSLEFAPSAK